MKRLMFFSALLTSTVALAGVEAATIMGISIPAPQNVSEKRVFEYHAAHFGFCARGAPCKNGERWLEDATAKEGMWLVPPAVTDEQVLAHYQKTLKERGWTIVGSTSDTEMRIYAIAATKTEKPLTHGIDIVLRNSTPADTPDAKLRVIEYWEGVGRPLGKNLVDVKN